MPEIIEQIISEVHHLEPWVPGAVKVPSACSVLLLKLLTMRLTVKQIRSLINHKNESAESGEGCNATGWTLGGHAGRTGAKTCRQVNFSEAIKEPTTLHRRGVGWCIRVHLSLAEFLWLPSVRGLG